MDAYLLSGLTAIDGGGNLSFLTSSCSCYCSYTRNTRSKEARRKWGPFTATATLNLDGQNHYAVLGVSTDASFSDIKKAYRLLALKYHPDVSKDAGADEIFKSIRLAYDVLSNDTTRNQYNQALRFQDGHVPSGGSRDCAYEDELRTYRWTSASFKRKKEYGKHWQQFQAREQEFSFYDAPDNMSCNDASDEERGSFYEVLKSVFLSLFLMQAVGVRSSLTFSSLAAFLDKELDAGYKIGYLIAWILGGRPGVMLSLLLSFASWLCGKTSSSLVALIVVAMWFGSNLASFTPIPQGALLTLLYMSIKLQVDLK